MSSTLENVQEYYGKVLQTNGDLKTNACCSADSLAPHVKDVVRKIHPEILEKFYGCGSPIPEALEEKTVLDLGCGTGRDCFVLSKLVGSKGKVIGIDMTDEQLAVANKHLDYQTNQFGYSSPNVQFTKGYIEDLAAVGIEDNSIDLVVSNCVINLSPEKEKVFSEIFRVLKPGGELFFSDVFSNKRVPKALREDPVIHGECLGGALYIEDFRRLLSSLGCPDFRMISSTPITLQSRLIEKKLGTIKFSSQLIRAFKIASLEDRCEDYGQVAWYLGTIDESPLKFKLDDHHIFEKGKPMLVCGNTASMLTETRLATHFRVDGDRSAHFGLFDCTSGPEGVTEPGACC